jgi:putative ABC transport system substrate-binding protein
MSRLSRRACLVRVAGVGAFAAASGLFGGCRPSGLPAMPVAAHRIGYLSSASRLYPDGTTNQLVQAFVDDVADLGWVEERNLTVEWRFADGNSELLPELAAELVRARPEVIVTAGTRETLAAAEQTGPIPIVMNGVADPVGSGLVATLAHPGGNITGVSNDAVSAATKGVEFLKRIVPTLSRLAVLADRGNSGLASAVSAAHSAASSLGLDVLDLDVRAAEDQDAAFASAQAWGADGLLTIPSPVGLFDIPARAVRFGLPAMHAASISGRSTSGALALRGLMSYATSWRARSRRVSL